MTPAFTALIDTSGEFAEINRKTWSPTPWVIDVFIPTDESKHVIRNWLIYNFGPESEPSCEVKGSWRASFVTVHSFCWYGFKTEDLMNRFLAKFPQPKRTT